MCYRELARPELAGYLVAAACNLIRMVRLAPAQLASCDLERMSDDTARFPICLATPTSSMLVPRADSSCTTRTTNHPQ
jgi:hypothetical protein